MLVSVDETKPINYFTRELDAEVAKAIKVLDSYIDSLRKRRDRGIKLLDKKRPGWKRKVKPALLELASGYSCILGQAYPGHFDEGIEKLNLSSDQIRAFGFDTDISGLPLEVEEAFDALGIDAPGAYDILNAVWLEALVPQRTRAKKPAKKAAPGKAARR